MRGVRGLLIDLDGVLRLGAARASPGAGAALARLRAAGGLPFRVLTNTTTATRAQLSADLRAIGLPHVEARHIFSAPASAAALLRAKRWQPHLLVPPALRSEFDDDGDDGDGDEDEGPPRGTAVVVGDPKAAGLDFAALNEAFRVVLDAKTRGASGEPYDAAVLALGGGRTWRDHDGRFSLDARAFADAIAGAAGVPVTVCGKPEASAFETAASHMGLGVDDCAMIGDDWDGDVRGGLRAGCASAVLVRTGKYGRGDEARADVAAHRPTHCAADFAAAIDHFLGDRREA